MKRNIISRILILTVALLPLASCMEVADMGDEKELALVPVASVTTKGSSAGPIAGTAFPENRLLLLSAYFHDAAGTGLSANYFTDITFSKYSGKWAGGTAAAPNPKYWPHQGTMDFIALSRANSASSTSLAGTVTHPDATSVAAKVQYAMPDNSTIQDDVTFAYAGGRSCTEAQPVPLVFRHAQAQVAVTAACSVNDATNNYGISLRGVSLRRAQYSGTVLATASGTDAVTLAWSSLGSQTASVPFGSTTARLTTSQAQYGKGIVLPPQSPTGTAGTIDILVEYTIHNGFKADGTTPDDVNTSYVYTVPAVSWQAGYKYIYAFTLTMNEITCTPTLVDWSDGGTVNIP